MPERARTDLWEPQGSNPLGPPGPELSPVPGTIAGACRALSRQLGRGIALWTPIPWLHQDFFDSRNF